MDNRDPQLKNTSITLIRRANTMFAAEADDELSASGDEHSEETGSLLGNWFGKPDLVITSCRKSAIDTGNRMTKGGGLFGKVQRVQTTALFDDKNNAVQNFLEGFRDFEMEYGGGMTLADCIAVDTTKTLEGFGDHAVCTIFAHMENARSKNCWVVSHRHLNNIIALKLLPYYLTGKQRESAIRFLTQAPAMLECGWFHIGWEKFYHGGFII